MTLLRRSQRTAEKAKAVKREDNSTVKQDKEPEKKEERTRVEFDYNALRAEAAYDQPDMYNTRMKPEDFNMDYYHLRGLNEVLLFKCAPEKLGMKMVNSSFKVQDVMRLVGGNKMIRASEVATQTAVDMPLSEFIKCYESPKTEDSPLYNVVSLEFSDTELADRVRPPDLIRNVDWASSWPDERKQREVKFKGDNFTTLPACPKVDSLCGMGPKGCYTDFHIDFHGSSFWFHVVRGLKVFWLIPLTNKNLELYHEYEMTYRNADNNQFFGTKVEKCVRIDVLPGNTLFVPAGYIHAVYTAEDSLIFSGNYLHNRAVKTQLKAIKEEKRSKLSKSVRYPFSDEVVMFYLAKIVKSVTGRVYIRPMSRNQHKKERGKNRLEYIGQLFKDKNKHLIVPTPEYYRERGGAWIPLEETDEFEQSKVKLAQRDAKKDGEKDGEKKKGGAKNDPKNDPRNHDDFFVDDVTFYHPESFNLDYLHPNYEYGNHTRPIYAEEPRMEVNREVLKEEIHSLEIPQLEALIVHYLNSTKVAVPIGLTRPNSLFVAFCGLLNERRVLATEDNILLPVSILPDSNALEKIHENNEDAPPKKKKKTGTSSSRNSKASTSKASTSKASTSKASTSKASTSKPSTSK